jgi:hypothetical protein
MPNRTGVEELVKMKGSWSFIEEKRKLHETKKKIKKTFKNYQKPEQSD